MGFGKIFLEILPSRLFLEASGSGVVRGWFRSGSGRGSVVKGVRFGDGSEVVRRWFGDGSGWFGGSSGVVQKSFQQKICEFFPFR